MSFSNLKTMDIQGNREEVGQRTEVLGSLLKTPILCGYVRDHELRTHVCTLLTTSPTYVRDFRHTIYTMGQADYGEDILIWTPSFLPPPLLSVLTHPHLASDPLRPVNMTMAILCPCPSH
jgi:hypothetical protein